MDSAAWTARRCPWCPRAEEKGQHDRGQRRTAAAVHWMSVGARRAELWLLRGLRVGETEGTSTQCARPVARHGGVRVVHTQRGTTAPHRSAASRSGGPMNEGRWAPGRERSQGMKQRRNAGTQKGRPWWRRADNECRLWRGSRAKRAGSIGHEGGHHHETERGRSTAHRSATAANPKPRLVHAGAATVDEAAVGPGDGT